MVRWATEFLTNMFRYSNAEIGIISVGGPKNISITARYLQTSVLIHNKISLFLSASLLYKHLKKTKLSWRWYIPRTFIIWKIQQSSSIYHTQFDDLPTAFMNFNIRKWFSAFMFYFPLVFPWNMLFTQSINIWGWTQNWILHPITAKQWEYKANKIIRIFHQIDFLLSFKFAVKRKRIFHHPWTLFAQFGIRNRRTNKFVELLLVLIVSLFFRIPLSLGKKPHSPQHYIL